MPYFIIIVSITVAMLGSNENLEAVYFMLIATKFEKESSVNFKADEDFDLS